MKKEFDTIAPQGKHLRDYDRICAADRPRRYRPRVLLSLPRSRARLPRVWRTRFLAPLCLLRLNRQSEPALTAARIACPAPRRPVSLPRRARTR